MERGSAFQLLAFVCHFVLWFASQRTDEQRKRVEACLRVIPGHATGIGCTVARRSEHAPPARNPPLLPTHARLRRCTPPLASLGVKAGFRPRLPGSTTNADTWNEWHRPYAKRFGFGRPGSAQPCGGWRGILSLRLCLGTMAFPLCWRSTLPVRGS